MHKKAKPPGAGTPGGTWDSDFAGERKSEPRQHIACRSKKRAGSSRRLDPVTRMHWKAADANTALAEALLKALRRKAVSR